MIDNAIPGLGYRIKVARKKRGYTQAELARLLNLKAATVNAYESGKANPSAPCLLKLAEILMTSTDALLGREHTSIDKQITLKNLTPSQEETIEKIVRIMVAQFRKENLEHGVDPADETFLSIYGNNN